MLPNYGNLGSDGYTLISTSGSYALVHKRDDLHLMEWDGRSWRRLNGELCRIVTRGQFRSV